MPRDTNGKEVTNEAQYLEDMGRNFWQLHPADRLNTTQQAVVERFGRFAAWFMVSDDQPGKTGITQSVIRAAFTEYHGKPEPFFDSIARFGQNEAIKAKGFFYRQLACAALQSRERSAVSAVALQAWDAAAAVVIQRNSAIPPHLQTMAVIMDWFKIQPWDASTAHREMRGGHGQAAGTMISVRIANDDRPRCLFIPMTGRPTRRKIGGIVARACSYPQIR